MEILEYVTCNLCSCREYKVLFGSPPNPADAENLTRIYVPTIAENIKLGQVVKCKNCGLIYTNPRINNEILIKIYERVEDQFYINERKHKIITAQRNLSTIEKFVKKGRILDIGCHAGFFLDAARQRGWETYGVEPSITAAKYAAEKLGLNVFTGQLMQADFEHSFFDVVTMYQVLEHLPDPSTELTKINRILKNNGLVVIDVPNIASFWAKSLRTKWWFMKDMHTYHFTPKTLTKMLEKTGFKVIKTASSTKTCSVKFLVTRLEPYSSRLSRLLLRLAEKLSLGDKPVSINMGDIFQIYAKKI